MLSLVNKVCMIVGRRKRLSGVKLIETKCDKTQIKTLYSPLPPCIAGRPTENSVYCTPDAKEMHNNNNNNTTKKTLKYFLLNCDLKYVKHLE